MPRVYTPIHTLELVQAENIQISSQSPNSPDWAYTSPRGMTSGVDPYLKSS